MGKNGVQSSLCEMAHIISVVRHNLPQAGSPRLAGNEPGFGTLAEAMECLCFPTGDPAFPRRCAAAHHPPRKRSSISRRKEASFRPRPSARTCLGNGNGSSLEAISFWLLESDSVKRHTAFPHRTRKFRRNAKHGALALIASR